MKQISLLFSLVIILLSNGCKKEQAHLIPERNIVTEYDSLVTFLKDNFPDQVSVLDLKFVNPLQYQKKTIGYQIFEKTSSEKFLLVKKDLSGYSGNWVDLTELKKSHSGNFSGRIALRNLKDETIENLIIENNEVKRVEKWDRTLSRKVNIYPGKENTIYQNSISKSGADNFQDPTLLPEIIIVINNRNYWSLFWLLNDISPFHRYYMLEEVVVNTSGGSPGGNNIPASPPKNSSIPKPEENDGNVIVLPVYKGPKSPIKNLADELKCLTVSPNSTYTISVNVNQPRPNSRDKVDPFNDFMVGHAFLSLEQTKADGSVIIRNIGYYPETSVYPGKYTDQSVFGEDSETPISVSLNISVSGDEMSTIINSLISQQSVFYDLENANCASSIISTLDKINIQMPSTSSGIYNLFKGLNPGDLGQDIRNLDVNKFGKDNGNRKVVKRTSEKNDLKPTPKKGSC